LEEVNIWGFESSSHYPPLPTAGVTARVSFPSIKTVNLTIYPRDVTWNPNCGILSVLADLAMPCLTTLGFTGCLQITKPVRPYVTLAAQAIINAMEISMSVPEDARDLGHFLGSSKHLSRLRLSFLWHSAPDALSSEEGVLLNPVLDILEIVSLDKTSARVAHEEWIVDSLCQMIEARERASTPLQSIRLKGFNWDADKMKKIRASIKTDTEVKFGQD
jgi:hypothetical protein